MTDLEASVFSVRTMLAKGTDLGVALLIALLLGLGSWQAIARDSGEKNLYVHQAFSFLNGRLDVDATLHDVAEFQGRRYVVFPPFPALLLTPFVAILGMASTSVVLVSVVLSALNVWLLLRVLAELALQPRYRLWIVAAFIFGTGYWLAVRESGGVWYFAHVVAVTCVLLALHSALVLGWGWLTGLCLGAAFLSRQLTVAMLLICCVALWRHSRPLDRPGRVANLLSCLIVLLLCVQGYLMFNAARFGSPLDTGYSYIPLSGFLQARVERFGLFHLAYLPFNALHMFAEGLHIIYDPIYLQWPGGIDPFGASLLAASPFLFAALGSRLALPLRVAAWAAVVLALAPMLLYYNNGFMQFNTQRFALDFLPALMLLVATALDDGNERLVKALIVYAIGLNVLVLLWLRVQSLV